MSFAQAKGVVSTRPAPGAHLSQGFLLRVLEDAPAGIAITRTRDHLVDSANAAFARLFGVRSIPLGRRLGASVPNFGAEALALLNGVYATGSAASVDCDVPLAGYGHTTVRFKAWPRPDGEPGDPPGLVILAQDVTPHALARRGLERLTDELRVANEGFILASLRHQENVEAAARQAAQLSAILGSLSDGVVVLDANGHVLVVNQIAEEILGTERRRLETLDDFRKLEVANVDGTPMALHERPLSRALRGEHIDAVECLIIRPDGRRRRVTISGRSVAGASPGEGRLAIVVCRDVSELRRVEALREASFERSESLRVIGEMATGIAHDLTNLINPLALQVSVLGGALEVGDTELGGRAISEARVVLRRAEETLARLNAFATGRGPTDKAEVDLVALAREAMLIAKPRMGRVMNRVVEEFGPTSRVKGSASEIVRALVNLLCNAIDASGDGGTITLRSGDDDGFAWIEVVDDGLGMAPEVLHRVFEPFFTTKGGLGTGMGLVMVKDCMDRHDGDVDIASTLGRGTRVALRFRIDPARGPVSRIRLRRR